MDEEPNGKHWAAEASVSRVRLLNEMFKDFKTPGSRDRLKRVANIPRYAIKQETTSSDIVDYNASTGAPSIRMDSPVGTVLKCEGHLFVCIGASRPRRPMWMLPAAEHIVRGDG